MGTRKIVKKRALLGVTSASRMGWSQTSSKSLWRCEKQRAAVVGRWSTRTTTDWVPAQGRR